ncbi:hypothetical protein BDY24DRAFT_196120 [Mrakia frigida]|uniref:uncharacterized protein n=1 Tax=Mrakia frigida TaxID=29902 RepID=UPI003FCC16CD
MGDIWSYSFRSHIDQDSEDEEEEEEGKGGGGEEKKKLMSREEEELSLLDLGGRADESQLVIKETPWTIAASRALPKGDRPPNSKSNSKKTTSNPPPPTPSSTSTSLPASKQPPSNHRSTSSHPPSKPKNTTVEVNASPPSSSSSKKRSSGSSSTEIDTHTPLPVPPAKLKGDSASTSQSEASGSKKKKKESSESSDSVGVVPAKKVTSGGKISFGRIPAGATADPNFPILQAFEHQAKTKPPRVRTPNPPTPPAAPPPVVVEAPKTSKKLKTLKHRSPLPISYYNPIDRRQPTIKATVAASSRRSIVENPSPVEPRSHTPPRPKGPPTSITSSSPASSNHTFREPPRSRRPLPQRVEVEDDEPFEEAPPPPSSLLPDEEPFSEDQTFEHTPLPPPSAVYYVPGIEPLQQRSPDTHSTYGEDEQLGRGGADWTRQRLYDGGEMAQKKRKLGSSKSTEGWKEVGEVQEGAPSRLSSASSRGGKRRSTFKPLVPFVPPPPPPPPPPQPSFNPPSPRHRQPSPQYQHSAYSHPAFESDRDDSLPVWSTLPPPKKKKLDPQGVTQLGRFRLPSFVPAPPSSSGSRASLFKRSESSPTSSRPSNPSFFRFFSLTELDLTRSPPSFFLLSFT